jgi:death-on-curing protein
MSREPVFILLQAVLHAHTRQIELHGGSYGVRDMGMLEPALARPKNLFAYEQATIPAMAAACTFGIVRNHPFVDGNKRVGFIAGVLFLRLNGHDFTAAEAEVVLTILRLAAGEIGEPELAAWFATNSRPRL